MLENIFFLGVSENVLSFIVLRYIFKIMRLLTRSALGLQCTVVHRNENISFDKKS